MEVVYTSIQQFLDSILGTYNPMVYIDSSGIEIPLQGMAGVDYPYIIRAITFIIVGYCTLKIIGALICKNY